jgi:hypothetical protein
MRNTLLRTCLEPMKELREECLLKYTTKVNPVGEKSIHSIQVNQSMDNIIN